MSLVIDRRQDVPGPGVHALVVGVSKYAHLPAHDLPPEAATWDLKSLGTSALAAAAVADWLRGAGANLAKPLKTLRLLLSPTDIELARRADWPAPLTEPTRNAFESAIVEWRKDCESSRDNVAFFYFAGHGFTRGRGDNNLLLTSSDLFAPGYTLKNAVLASNIFNGMAPQTATDNVAREQFYFFDCCRTYPAQLASFDDKNVLPVLNVLATEGVPDNRAYGRWYATQDNTSAYGSTGKGTAFGAALVDALEKAGRKIPGVGWCVDARSITLRLSGRYTKPGVQGMDQSESSPGPILRTLQQAPTVDLDLMLEPTGNAAGRDVAFHRQATLHPASSGPNGPGWYRVQVPASTYDIQVRPDPHAAWSSVEELIVLPETDNPHVLRGWP